MPRALWLAKEERLLPARSERAVASACRGHGICCWHVAEFKGGDRLKSVPPAGSYPLPPRFFVSVDSKEFKISVSRLKSTLAGGSGSVDSK